MCFSDSGQRSLRICKDRKEEITVRDVVELELSGGRIRGIKDNLESCSPQGHDRWWHLPQ